MDRQSFKEEAIGILKNGTKDEWNKFKSKAITNNVHLSDGRIDLNEVCLSNFDLSGYDLSSVCFRGAALHNANLTGADLSNSVLTKAQLYGTILEKTFGKIYQAIQTKFDNKTVFKNTKIFEDSSEFSHCVFIGANLRNIDFRNKSLRHSSFTNADVRGCNFRKSNLSGTFWEGTKIDATTDFYLSQWQDHDLVNDKSDTMKYVGLDKVINWKFFRALKQIPIFQISSSFLLVFVYLTLTADYLEENGLLEAGIPLSLIWLIAGSFCLLIGSLIFNAKSPEVVRDFTESEWVYAHNHPRQLYRSASLKKQYSLIAALFFLVLGGGILFVRLVWPAITLVFELVPKLI